MSGAVAGTIHAIAGAPADNVRLLLEGGSHRLDFHGTGSGWRQAWLEVFRKVDHVGPPHIEHGQVVSSIGSLKTRREAREFRAWMKEVKGMARGWDGMWWGCGKDALGFAIFFAVFDASRQLANATAAYFDPSIKLTRPPPAPTSSDSPQPHDPNPFEDDYETKTHLPSKITKARIGHGLVLVSGGVDVNTQTSVPKSIKYVSETLISRVSKHSPDHRAHPYSAPSGTWFPIVIEADATPRGADTRYR
ncbi:hypothetical protein FRB99_000630 [Tulasnella sp. 403]|nr:hypothetical protein FRB99_000630 [Tulasnella sp. 403]